MHDSLHCCSFKYYFLVVQMVSVLSEAFKRNVIAFTVYLAFQNFLWMNASMQLDSLVPIQSELRLFLGGKMACNEG